MLCLFPFSANTHTHTSTHTCTNKNIKLCLLVPWCIAVLNTYVCLFREGSMNGLALMQSGLEGGRLRWKEEETLKQRR